MLADTITGEIGVETQAVSKHRMLQGDEHDHHHQEGYRCAFTKHDVLLLFLAEQHGLRHYSREWC